MSKKAVVAIGVFDGVHIGHQRVLKETVKIARRVATQAVAVTFNPHPISITKPKYAPPSLISLEHRIRLIYNLGVDRCVVFDFTKDFADIRPEFFVKDILIKRLNAGWVVVGEDFCFGSDKSGNAEFLMAQGRALGFSVKKVKAIKYKKFLVSSSLIRRLIQKGQLDLAKRLLGRPVGILGTVVRGKNLGETIGFPTANINPHHEVVPPRGVYVVEVKIDNKVYGGVLNIGTRPTFYTECSGFASRASGSRSSISKIGSIWDSHIILDEEPTIEVHIFDFSKRIYGKIVQVLFLKRLRSERRFVNKEALAAQIEKDTKKAKEMIR